LLGVEVDRGVDAGDEDNDEDDDEDDDEDVGDLWGRRGDLGGRGRRLDAVVLINIAAICSWSSGVPRPGPVVGGAGGRAALSPLPVG
jgi:hypothetical protein